MRKRCCRKQVFASTPWSAHSAVLANRALVTRGDSGSAADSAGGRRLRRPPRIAKQYSPAALSNGSGSPPYSQMRAPASTHLVANSPKPALGICDGATTNPYALSRPARRAAADRRPRRIASGSGVGHGHGQCSGACGSVVAAR
jgi:hypothetical protein